MGRRRKKKRKKQPKSKLTQLGSKKILTGNHPALKVTRGAGPPPHSRPGLMSLTGNEIGYVLDKAEEKRRLLEEKASGERELGRLIKEDRALLRKLRQPAIDSIPYMEVYERLVEKNGVGLEMDSAYRRKLYALNRGMLTGLGIRQNRSGKVKAGDFPFTTDLGASTSPDLYLDTEFYCGPREGGSPIWKLREELHHCFSLRDYSEWESERKPASLSQAYDLVSEHLAEGVVYHYNVADPIKGEGTRPLGASVVGLSMVRNKSLLNILARLPRTDVDAHPRAIVIEYDHELRQTGFTIRNSNDLMISTNHTITAADTMLMLKDRKDHQRLKAQIKEFGVYWPFEKGEVNVPVGSTTELDMNDGLPGIMSFNEKKHHLFKGNMLVEGVTRLALLPLYFAFKVNLIKEAKCRTRVGGLKKGQKLSKKKKRFEEEQVLFRLVKSINVKRISTPTGEYKPRNYVAPSYQVPTKGHRRRLKPGQWGKDSEGNPVLGWTWVEPHFRHRDKPFRPIKTIYLKQTTEAARELGQP